MTKLLKTIRETIIISKRNFLKMMKTPEEFMDTLIFPIVFLLLFTYIFGGAIQGTTSNYLPIIIPGMLVFCILNTAGETGTNLREDIETGIFNRFKSMPISRIAPLSGKLMSDSIRFFISILVTYIISIIMGFWPANGSISLLVVLIFLVFCGYCISWIFAFIGVIMRTSSSVQGISSILTFPVIFVSNAFVPVDTMPEPLQIVANINPVTHIINAVKDILYGTSIFTNEIFIALSIVILSVLIFAPLTLKVYLKKM